MTKLIRPTRRGLIKTAAAALITSPAIIRRAEAMMRGGLAVQSSGGGGFSDSDWPSVLNRPALSGNVLTWVGPLGGGPNNGNPVQQSRNLGSSVGGFSTTGANQTIAGKNISGSVTVLHNNCTIQQNRIVTSNSQGVSGCHILIGANVTGLTIEDNLLDGSNTSKQMICALNPFSLLATTKNIIRRNYLTGVENHITLSDAGGQNNVEITDNYFTACSNTANPSFDGDMIEIDHIDTLLVQHNQFDGSNSQLLNQAFNSMVNVANEDVVANVLINNNLFSNCSTLTAFVLCDGPDFSTAPATFGFTNNGYYNPGLPNSLPISLASGFPVGFDHGLGAHYTMTPNSGNYFAATPTATSGPLINGGTGAV